MATGGERKASAGTAAGLPASAETAALWSAIRQERRAADERASPSAGRCGWLPRRP